MTRAGPAYLLQSAWPVLRVQNGRRLSHALIGGFYDIARSAVSLLLLCASARPLSPQWPRQVASRCAAISDASQPAVCAAAKHVLRPLLPLESKYPEQKLMQVAASPSYVKAVNSNEFAEKILRECS